MSDPNDDLQWLMSWYATHCNGKWEHQFGVKIETLDNPGWIVEIDLTETELGECAYDSSAVNRSQSDWLSCKVENQKFIGAGDVTKLTELIRKFRLFAQGRQAASRSR